MPLGSSKLGFVKNAQYGVGGTGIPVDDSITIDLVLSGNTEVRLLNSSSSNGTPDANTVTYNIDTNFVNTTIAYNFTGVLASDFTDATLTGTVTTDASGNASVAKTITNSGGHKVIAMDIIRPNSNVLIGSANTLNLYEVTPITISGGDTTLTSNITQLDYDAGGASAQKILVAHKQHRYTNSSSSNATLTVTNTGNYTGNANIWANQYLTTASSDTFESAGSYWQEGVKIRSLIIGRGGSPGSQGGSGAGEVGVLGYTISDISAGSYNMFVGGPFGGNTIVFNGNTTLQRTAGQGQDGAGTSQYLSRWGSGNGGSNAVSGSFIKIQAAPTDLAENVANVNFPDNLAEHVEWASACRGGFGYGLTRDGGGGAGGVGGVNNAPHESPNKYGVAVDSGPGGGSGGHGITVPNNRDYPVSSTPGAYTSLSTWYKNPVFTGENNSTEFAGGKKGSAGSDGIGVNGWGGGNDQQGVITISYPYRPAYRFVTTTDLS